MRSSVSFGKSKAWQNSPLPEPLQIANASDMRAWRRFFLRLRLAVWMQVTNSLMTVVQQPELRDVPSTCASRRPNLWKLQGTVPPARAHKGRWPGKRQVSRDQPCSALVGANSWRQPCEAHLLARQPTPSSLDIHRRPTTNAEMEVDEFSVAARPFQEIACLNPQATPTASSIGAT